MDYKKGDAIKCEGTDDAVNKLVALYKEGYEVDFCYNLNGEKGLTIIIKKEGNHGN